MSAIWVENDMLGNFKSCIFKRSIYQENCSIDFCDGDKLGSFKFEQKIWLLGSANDNKFWSIKEKLECSLVISFLATRVIFTFTDDCCASRLITLGGNDKIWLN